MSAIAIVEDNADLLDDLIYNLEQRGFTVDGFADGVALDAALNAGASWQVLLLDLGLPGEDGLSITRRLRNIHPALGIIALTARGRVEDRIDGLEQGIDLYLVKPVDLAELTAAIHAVTRRVAQSINPTPVWQLDPLGRQLITPQGTPVSLSHAELQIMTAFAEVGPATVSRDQLMIAIGRKPDCYENHALEAIISRLRLKLGKQGPIRAARGVGYCFTARLACIDRP